ncbi:MAG: hypothetical protein IJQ10_00185 [Clostridia bacterium]|nr:hypothetical protein [Clostridia bacterium]
MEIFTDKATKRKYTKYYYFFAYAIKEEAEQIIKKELSQKEIKEIKIVDTGNYLNAVAYVFI